MTTYTTAPRPDETVILRDDPTRLIPARRLPRPEETAVIYMQTLPPREFILLPDRTEPIEPDVVPLRPEPEPLRPTLYRGQRRVASQIPPWAWVLLGVIGTLVVTR